LLLFFKKEDLPFTVPVWRAGCKSARQIVSGRPFGPGAYFAAETAELVCRVFVEVRRGERLRGHHAGHGTGCHGQCRAAFNAGQRIFCQAVDQYELDHARLPLEKGLGVGSLAFCATQHNGRRWGKCFLRTVARLRNANVFWRIGKQIPGREVW